MIREDLRRVAVLWLEAGWQRGDVEAVRRMYASDFVDLSSPYSDRGSAEDNLHGITELYVGFPDFFAVADDPVIDESEGKVAVRWSATGTHLGPFMGADPTGRNIRFRGIETLRVRDGLIVERAGEWDALGLLEQLRSSSILPS